MLSLMSSGGCALVAALLSMPFLLRYLQRRSIGQHIREDGPESHAHKAGTPTMGGLVIVGAVILGYALAHIGTEVRFSAAGYLVVIAVACFGLIGFLDDWIKVRHQRSLGLNKRAKFGAQVLAGVLFAELAEHWAHTSTKLTFTGSAHQGIQLGSVGWVVFCVFVLVATSNAVNLTDGLDGLAAGSSTMCFAVLAIMGFWIFRHRPDYELLPASAIDLALVSVALAGACLGFLWYNAAPAKIIMGDTGSLSIGAGVAAVALLLNLDLLLPILGGLFVIETLSVIVQVAAFRTFRTRVLKMAPIHHHFELLGWPETTVIVRFWIMSGLFAALALGVFYADYLAGPQLK